MQLGSLCLDVKNGGLRIMAPNLASVLLSCRGLYWPNRMRMARTRQPKTYDQMDICGVELWARFSHMCCESPYDPCDRILNLVFF